MKKIKDFSKKYGNNIINFQGTGGNISFKEDNYLYIKSSGYKISDIYKKETLSKIKISGFFDLEKYHNISKEYDLVNLIEENNISILKASIETGFHLLLDKYVIHTHNIYINILLCMKGGEDVLNKLFGSNFTFIDYYSPGLNLFNAIKKEKNIKEIIFLKNHGIILHGNESFIDLYNKLNNIQNIIIKELNLEKYIFTKGQKYIKKHIFPDTIIIKDKDIYSSYNYIKKQIRRIGGKINFLSRNEVDYIKNMKQEKYRKKIFNKNYKG